MAEQYTPNIGELCGDDARRDAVHFAVAPVEADMDLRPGDHVGVTRGRASRDAAPIGIVDPFFKGGLGLNAGCVQTCRRLVMVFG